MKQAHVINKVHDIYLYMYQILPFDRLQSPATANANNLLSSETCS